MKRISVLIILIIFIISLNMAYAEDNPNITDNSTSPEVNNTVLVEDINLTDNSTHNHSQISNIIQKSIVNAPGGTFNDFQNIINGLSNGDTVQITGNYYYNSGFSTNGININKANIIIEGNGYTFDGLNTGRVFKFASNGITLKNLNIVNAYLPSNGDSANMGGGIVVFAWYCSIYNCSFINCSSSAGGAIALQDNTVQYFILANSTFINNSMYTTREGGAMHCYGCHHVSITGCIFIGNHLVTTGRGNIIEFMSTVSDINVTNNVLISVNNGQYDMYSDGGTINYNNNWWGTNTPEFTALIYSGSSLLYDNVPEAWVVMNFTNSTPFSYAGASVSVTTNLDWIYNHSSHSYQKLVGDMPLRNVTYNISSGSISNSISEFLNSDTQIYTSPVGVSSVTLTATVDEYSISISNPLTTGSFTQLQKLIDNTPNNGILILDKNYTYNPGSDLPYAHGMFLNKTITILGNGYTINGINQSRIFNITGSNIILDNITFTGGYTVNKGYNNEYTGGAIYSFGDNLTISNSIFKENYAKNYGAAINHNNGTIHIINSSFINNTMPTTSSNNAYAVRIDSKGNISGCLFEDNNANHDSAIYLREGNLTGNVFINNKGTRAVSVGSNVNVNYNWWGNNTPTFNNLITGTTPQTWAVFSNFTNLQTFSSSGGIINLFAEFDSYYNRSTGTYAKLPVYLPTRTIIYESTAGTISPNITNISINSTVNLNYPSGLSVLTLSATIDNETLYIKTSDLEVNISISNNNPTIAQKVFFTISVRNNGPDNATNVWVNVTLPSVLTYLNHRLTTGSYNSSSGIWTIGNITNGTNQTLIVNLTIPLNQTLINTTQAANVSVNGTYIDLNEYNNKDSVNFTIYNKTSGSYTELQELIDLTPVGGVLNLAFNVTYDPVEDYWLRHGMLLNKSFTFIGNGYTISGIRNARIFRVTASNVTVMDTNIINGYDTENNFAGAVFINNKYFSVINCTFIGNNGSAGGAIGMPNNAGEYLTIANCTFINNTIYTSREGGVLHTYGTSHISITGCLFINNTIPSGRGNVLDFMNSGSDINVTNNVFLQTNNGYYEIYTDNQNINFENNWWGNNTPNWNMLIRGHTPETYVIMNFTTNNAINIGTGGTITLETTLNTIYNTTTGNYSSLIGGLPVRNVSYTANTGSFTPTKSTITNSNTTTFTYPGGAGGLELNATIDNQTLTLYLLDISFNITNITINKPEIGNKINFTLTVTNNGPKDLNYTSGYDALVLNFTLPFPLNFISYSGEGIYNSNTSLWYVGNLSSGQSKNINISVRIPYNKTLVGMLVDCNLTYMWGHYLHPTYSEPLDNVTLEIQNKSSGSYTDLQALIDLTPVGGTLDLDFNVTYDPVGDAWLRQGMLLNKTMTFIGHEYVISGNNTARIFRVTANNVTLKDTILINGYDYENNCGGAIIVYNNYFSVYNCNFTNNSAGAGGAIGLTNNNGNYFTLANSTFTNNSIYTSREGGVYHSYGASHISITGCIFKDNYIAGGRGNVLDFMSGGSDINVTNNVFLRTNNGYQEVYTDNQNINFENNWWGNNTPNWNMLIRGYAPQTYVIMNFTNTTPITTTGSTANLIVTLNNVFNSTNNGTNPLIGYLPVRNLTFSWNQGTVTPNTTNIQGTATSTFTYPSNMGAWIVNATIDNQTLSIGSADIEIIIIPNKNPINDGDNITFNITVRNNGLVKATDINLTLYLPYGLINITTYTNNGTFNNTTNIWTIGDLNVLENVTLTLNGTLFNPGEYLLLNASINTSHFYDDNLTNNNVTCNVTVIQWSDLVITKNISELHPKTKDNITFTITVFNNGPSTAINVTVLDNLSSKLIFQYYNSTNGIYNATTGIWFINNITPNSTETLNITVMINESGITTNEVNVSCAHNDTNWTNNYANVTFETAPLSDLWVTINMDPQTSNFITFHIQAGNNGIEPANGTIVELNISSLMVYVNHTTDGGVYGCSTGVWDIGYIRVNETVNLTLILQLNFPAGLNVTNITTCANITSWSTDLYPENNTDNITFEAEIYGNFRLLQQLIDNQPANTVFVLPRSFAYDSINDAFIDGVDTYDLINGVSIYKNLTIVNPDGYTIGGFGMARCLNITANNVILDGLKIADGYSPLGAGLNIPASNVQVLRSNFTNNVLWGDYGGAIYVSGTNVLIQDNYFERNNASKLGGAIGAIRANNLRILNNTFINNSAKSDDLSGGAIGLLNSQATINTNVFLDNNATSSAHIGSAIYINDSNVNLEANWFGNNTPDMTTDELIYGTKPETWIILDWEIVNPNMTGVELNIIFVLYNSTSGEKTPINYGLPYRKLNVTARDPTLSWYNTTYIGNNSVNYTYNTAIPVYQINATVDYETISLEFSTLLNVYKTCVNDTIWFGDNLIYNVTIVNYGPHNTQTIMIEDLIPSGLTINNLIKTTGSTSQIGGNVYWGLVVLAGTNTTLLINTTPTVEGNYTNNISVNTSTPLDYFINGTNKTVTGHVLGLSDLEVNLTISSPHYYVGENIVYNVRVANYGPSIAENIIVSMPVSSGLTYLYQDWPGTYSQSTGIWNIASLNPGDILDINITFRINSPGWYNQTINITSDSVDINLDNNNKTLSFNVTNQVDLVLNMTINKGGTLYGDDSVYITLNLYNRGPSAADNVTVFLYYGGLNYWYASSGYGSFVNDTPTAGRWLVGTLNANTSTYITLRFVANTLGNFTITGRANNTYNDSNWADNYANVTISVIKYADLSINKIVSDTTVYVGQIINYTITVTNLAGFDAENVTVTDILNQALIYDNNNPNYNGTHWFVGNLTVGETRNITFNVTVNASGYIWNNATVKSNLNDSNINNNHVEVRISSEYQYADLSITKTVNKSNPFLGENVTFAITVKNNGAYNTENVTVYDPLPTVLLYDGNNPEFNGTHWFVGNLSVGETKNITYIVTVDGVGIIWNNATVNSSLHDPNTGNNHAEVPLDVPIADDLRIYINVIPNPPQANGNFIINISVWNRGFTDNTNVTVEFHLPPTLAYVNSTQMGSYNWITGFWDIGYLPNGAWTNLEIVVYPLTIDNITLECNVSGSVTDTAPWNNRANITFEIVPSFDLTVTKTALNSSIIDGDEVSFEISVWNNGPNLARNVEIIDYLPSGTTYLFDNSSGVYNNISRTVNWTIPQLDTGDNITIYLILKSWGPGLTLTNTVTVSAYGTDSNITDNTATSTVNVTQKSDLEIRLNASKIRDVDLGETISFYITVINHGPSNAAGVISNFTLPSNFIYVSDNGLGSYNSITGLWSIGSLGSNSNTTLTVNAKLNTIGLIKLNATVNGTYIDNDTSNNIAFLNITATPVYDLNITAHWNLTNNTVPWGYLANYTVIVSNKGPDNATNVTVSLTIPGVNYVSHTGAGLLNTTSWIWNVGNLTVGETRNITITFNATNVGFFISKGSVTAYGNDNNTDDNNYTLNLTVIPVVDLVMTNITVNTTVTCVDGILEFNVTVFNRGPCNATNTTIVPFLPTGWTIYGGMLTGNVPFNSSEVFTILVNATTLGNYSIGFNATINGLDTYPLDNNLTFATIQVIYACDLMITIKTNKISTTTGDIVVYVITVTNLDWRTAHNVTANVTIPSGLIFDHMYLASGSYNPSNGTWTIGNMSYRNSTTLFLFTRTTSPGSVEFWVNVTGDDYDFHIENNNNTVNITVGPGLDLNITILADNNTPYTGDNATFTVIVENIGLIDARDVYVDFNIPSGFINPSSLDLNFTGTGWFVGNLTVGSIKTLNFTLIPVSTSNLTINVTVGSNRLDYNISNNFANVTVSPIAATDLTVTITSNNSNPKVNENVTYTITITNNGLIDADNVLVYNNLPFSLTYDTSTPTYSPISKLWLISNLTKGATETLNITINHTTPGIYNYTVNITSSTIETNISNNLDNITITVMDDNDLITIFTVNNNTILDEDILNFTITVYNNGTYNNTNVKVYTNLPSTNTYTDYGFFDSNLGIWEVGNLTAYENKTINILVNITHVGNYTFWANSTGDQKDKNTTNNNQSLNITIYTDYDITVNITVNNNSIFLGDTLNFTITVTNYGPSTAHNTNLTYNITGTPTTINIGELNNNETRTYNIIHTPITGGIINCQVNITADNPTYDRNTTNNRDNITINITTAVDLIININANATIVNRGDYVEFNITIYNNGSNTANNVIIEYNNLFEGTILSSTVTNGFISPVSWFIPTLAPYTLETLIIRRTIDNNTFITSNVTSNTYELNKDNNYANITINVTKITDLQVIITANQTDAYLGDNITFTVTVINHGNDTAENVTVKLDLPYSTEYTDVYMYDSLNGIWNIGILENNTNRTINITVTMAQPGITTYNATVNTLTSETNTMNNYDNVTINITSILDLEIKINSNITGNIYTGDLTEFQVTVTNHGPSNATNTIVNLNLPGTIFIPTKGTYAGGTWNIGTLNTGETANLTIQRIIQSTDTGIYNANVTANELDKNTTNNNATINVSVEKTSDLEIRITASTLSTDLGNILYYTINVINNGPDNVSSAIANISLPSSFNIQSNMSNNGIFNGTHWILSNLNIGLGSMATLIIYGNYTGYGNQTVKTIINSSHYDSNLTNNNASISIWIVPACDLIVNFTTTGYYNPDGTMTFNITVTNNGPCNTTNATLYTNLPTSTDYNETNRYFDSIQNIWYIGDLTAGQSETLIINTTMISGIKYYANITSPTKELNTTNNIKYLNLTVTPIVDLGVNITVNNSNPLLGESITFTVTATNLGYYNASNVTVYTNLPSSPVYTISKGLFDTVYGNWSIGKLDVGETATLQVTINATSIGTFTHTVNITGSVNDTKTDNNNDTVNYTVNATTDIGINVNINQTSLIVGDNVTFIVNVINYGSSDAENITLELTFPTGFIINPITVPTGVYNNGTWNITTLGNGSNITLNISGILNSSGIQTFSANITKTLTYDNNTSNNYDSINFNVNDYADLTVNITSDNLTVFAGDYITLTINVTNYGPSNAENITVNTGIYNATSTKDIGYYDKNTGYWFIENLTTNTTITLNLTIQITTNTTYLVTVNTTSIESNISNNNASINITVNPLVDLNITVRTNSLVFYENDTIIYTIIVVNNGYSIAENVNLTVDIPFAFLSSNNTNYNNITGIWNIGNLNPKETQILTLKYQANTTGNNTSYFQVNTTTLEFNLTDNNANITIFVDNTTRPITDFVDLIINITVDNSTPSVNSTITFNITVYNNATLTATNITIVNHLPTGLTPIGTYTGIWTINNLTAYENKSFTFTVNVTAYGSFVDNVTADCNQWDINPTNNRANQLIIVSENKGDYLDLSINVTRIGNTTIDELITYNITVTNQGPTDAYDVNVTIGLFEGLNLTSSSSSDYNETNSLWNVGNLTSGASKTLTITLNITQTGLYTNIFLVWSNEMDKNPQNNLALDTFAINDTRMDVNIKITANKTYGKINDSIQLTVTVTNPSNNPATNVNITLDIPTDFEITNFTGYDNGSYYIGTLNSSQTVTFNFTVKINTTNTATITVNATINETDYNLIDNIDNITITTITGGGNGVADLTVNITSSLLNLTSGNMELNQYPEYGDVPYFTVYVTNHGPDNATNIRVPLTVPNGCSIMAQDAYWDNTTESFIVSNLSVNQTIKLEVSMLIETTDVLLINATATCDQFDPNITDNTATISMYPFIPEPKCDLNVTVKVIGNEFYANSTVTFNITIRNDGQYIENNVTVRNTIPTGLIFHNITTYDAYTLNGDGWDIAQILPGASMQFLVTYNITKKGLYQTTVNANSTIQDTDPTSNGMGVAFYAGEAEPPRREVKTKLNSPTVTTTAGKVQLAGGDWTFVGTLKFANNTAAPSSYTNFAGQTLYANVTDDAGVTRTYVSSTVTGSDGKATFIVPHADVGAGGTKFSIIIWYKGEKTDTDYYLPCVSSAKNNIKVVP